MLSVSIVNASTDADNTTTSTVNDAVKVSSENDAVTSLEDNTENTVSTKSAGNSFKDLKEALEESDHIYLTQDYEFDEQLDDGFEEGIIFEDSKTVIINGNNHTIDAKNKATIFQIFNSSVLFKNIVFKNSINETIYVEDSVVISRDNVYFNELNNSRAFKIYNSRVTSDNDYFKDNYYKQGSSIFSAESNLKVVNATFENKNELEWSSVYLLSSKLNMSDTVFSGITSKYAPAIFFDNSTGNVTNSVFKNLTGILSAGAIGVKKLEGIVNIDNSMFIDVSSSNNGGAIFADVSPLGVIILNNSYFESCYSMYGGAVVQLDGNLLIENTTFKDNFADLSGGAVYTSDSYVKIQESLFDGNAVLIDDEYYFYGGGALSLDNSVLSLNDSVFTNNTAYLGEDIYMYDGSYSINNSVFEGNIYTFFDKTSYLKNNTFLKDNNTFNDTIYPYVYEGPGTTINYEPVILDENLINNSYFNLVDYGLVTPVKDQGYMGACWTFGAIASLESAFLKATNKTLVLDISENNLQNIGLKYNPFGNSDLKEGGLHFIGATYFLSWLGVINAEDDMYDELGKLSPIMDNGSKYYVYDLIYIQPRQDINDNLKLKEALIKYGALAVSVYGASGDNSDDYNNITSSAYYNSTFGEDTDHSVCLVGWDDNFPKENFKKTPPGDGAWIVKNSWGDDWGDNGYYYVSYYDTAIATNRTVIAFTIDNQHNYERNYEYDLISSPVFNNFNQSTVSYLNKYTAAEDELISAIGTYFNDSNVKYELTIYVDNEQMITQNGTSSHAGYETIKLNQKVGVPENHTFMVEIGSNNIPFAAQTRLHHEANSSYISYDKIYALNDENPFPILKAYTITDKSHIDAENITTQYGAEDYIKATYYDEKGEILANQKVQYTLNDKVYNTTTDSEGKLVLGVDLKPGIYIISLINPANLEKTNITLTILPAEDDINKTVQKYHVTIKPVKMFKNNVQTHKIYVNDHLLCHTNYITIETLNSIFNNSFINGHLLVYIDGVLVFNGTVTDDIYTIILEITGKLLGQHELKVVFTDSNNNTNTYTENITIT